MHNVATKQTVRELLEDPSLPRQPTRVPRLTWEDVSEDRNCVHRALDIEWEKWRLWGWCEAGEDDLDLRQVSCTGFVMRFFDGLRKKKGPRVPKLLEMSAKQATKTIMKLLRQYHPWIDISTSRIVQPGDLIVCHTYYGIPVHSMIVATKPRHIWHCTSPIGVNESAFVLPPGNSIWRILRAEDRILWG